jgi:O-glycosyl hydrolase
MWFVNPTSLDSMGKAARAFWRGLALFRPEMDAKLRCAMALMAVPKNRAKSLSLILWCSLCAASSLQAQLFSDDFTRATDPGPLTPWTTNAGGGNWTVTSGVMLGGPNPTDSYGFAFITNLFTNFSAQAQFQFPVGAYGGGLGGRLNPANGSHYALWIYPENSAGGSNVLKLLRFDSYSSFVVLQTTNLAAVGTNFHTATLQFSGSLISAYLDTNQLLSTNDATYPSGSISLDFWTDTTAYQMTVANVAVYAFPPATVTVNGAQTYQVIDGFGVNANHRSWTNNELEPVLDALIDQAGMTLFRVVYDNSDWETNNHNSGPTLTNWTYFSTVYNSWDFQALWGIMAYLNQKGITNGVIPNFQGFGPSWMGGLTLKSGYENNWAEMIASALVYARYTNHLQFTLVEPNNEPDIAGSGIETTETQYPVTLDDLSQQLNANGMGDVRFVGPDLGNTSTAWLSTMMSDTNVMAKLAHFGLHSYQDNGGGSVGVYDFLQESAYPDITYWMTEFNVWCASCQAGVTGTNSWDYACGAARYLIWDLYYGASAGMVWDGYDSIYRNNNNDGLHWTFWGLFAINNTNAVPKTYTPRKIFYTLSQITQFVRPGAQQIDESGSFGPFLLVPFYQPDSGQLTLTGINADTKADVLSVVLANLPPVASLDLYYTDSTTNLCHSATFPVTNGFLAATVPANCVFTLVGFDPARIAVSVLITNPVDGAFYSAPATIPIQASATTTTGNVSQVEFFSGTTDLGGVVPPPYSITWSNVPPGTYALTACATNSVGDFRVSPVVHVTVVGPIAQISLTPSNAAVVPYGTQQFTASAADALGTVIDPPLAFAWSVSGGGTIDTNGLFTAGGSVGGPFALVASDNGITGTASVSVAINVNLAPAGAGCIWYSLTASTNSSPQAAAPGVNDGDLTTDVPLTPGGTDDLTNAYEAAGVVWSTPQTINRVIYYNGSYTTNGNGVFADEFGLQFSPDGSTWTNADPAWTVAPAYVYNSAASGNASFTFTGGVATVLGVRCVGRVNTADSPQNSWLAFATEVQAFAAPVPTISVLITNPVDGASYTAPATIPIQASAITTTGSISQVEFFSGTTDLGGVVAAPYGITWSNVPPGAYLLAASATNSVGNFGVSPVVHVTVVGPTAQISLTPTNAVVVPCGTQQFIAAAADALGTVIDPPPPFAWSVSGGGTIDTNGLFTAGGSVGGPFTIAASDNGVTGTASVSVATNVNLAPAGAGYIWYSMAGSTDSLPQAAAPGINDGDLNTDVPLTPGGTEDLPNAYEAAGVVWSNAQTINRVIYYNGSYTTNDDGVFADGFGLQFSPDGSTWTNAGPAWTVAPAYVYNSAASGNASFTFTGSVATVLGVRCVGRVHTVETSQNSWVAFATEVRAFAAPVPAPPMLTASAVSNGIAISWPGSPSNYVLEAATNLLPPVTWSPVANTPQPVGGLLTITVPSTSACQYFRLHQQ